MLSIRVLLYFGLVVVLPALCHPHISCTLTQRAAICNNLGLSFVPSNLPHQTEELLLNQNTIYKLHNGCLSRYPFLRMLSCANCLLNSIGDQVFSSSALLESVNFADNELNKEHSQFAQSVGSLTRLRFLDLSGNGLTEEMASELLQNLTTLEYLDLSRNVLLRLDEYTFRALHQLKELNLERNILFEIDAAFDHLKKLRRLNLAFNSLPCLVKFEMTQLVVLNASHNLIEWFITNDAVTETFELETLDLSDNQLLYFPFLPIYNRIKTLLLSNNHIGFYSHLSQNGSLNWTNTVEFYNLGGNSSNVTAELWSDDLHGNISSVEFLDISVNQVRYFPQGFLRKMPHLYWLRMRNNCLESLNLTDELPVTVYELDVSNNRLAELHTHSSSVSEANNLTHLNLSLNNIQKLPSRVFTTFPSLSIVDLSYNSVGLCQPDEQLNLNLLACAVWANLSTLRQLHISGCNLKRIPPLAFNGTPLTHLDLSNNPDMHIGQDSLSGLSGSLQHLSLSNTGLQDFNFSPFKQLKFLNISKNFISELPKSLTTLNLKLLDLRDNMLSTIYPEHANALAKQVQMVYINGNNFNCCQLEWYKTFEELKLQVADRLEVTCIDKHQQRLRAGVFDSVVCGGKNTDEAIFWYVLLFLSVGVSMLGVSVIYFLTFRPQLLPPVIKKKCLKPTTY